MSYVTHTLLIEVPFIALAALSIVLVHQHRSLVTALAAFGFSCVALSHIASMFLGLYAFALRGDLTAALHRFSWTLPVIYWGSVVGLWVGSLSLLWYAVTPGSRASPNQRLERP